MVREIAYDSFVKIFIDHFAICPVVFKRMLPCETPTFLQMNFLS